MTQEEIMLAYARKRRRRIYAALVAVFLLFVGASAVGQIFGDRYGMVTAVVVLVGFLVFVWRDWRCPACGHALGAEFDQRHCPYCGTRLVR